ncbi:hypothetical protein SDC9_26455 [bioreactor metagenome]|uniref:Uncharacterized protein n=1 Tax=bioreactor metagenome TaxID=1076179 RepID=A0A644UNP8_9ZZZZ
MHHRVADLDAGREAVRQHPACHPLEHRQQPAGERGIIVIHVQRGGQLAHEAARHAVHLVGVARHDHKAERPEHLFGERVIAQPVLGLDAEQEGFRLAPVAHRGDERLHAGLFADHRRALGIGLRDAVGQHHLRAGFRQRRAGSLDEGIGLGSGDHHRDARVGAELARAHGERARPAPAQLGPAPRDRLRQHEHRVDRAELAEEGDRLGALRAKVKEGAAAAERAGEAHRLDAGMLHQRLADAAVAALHEREHALRQAAFLHCGMDRLGDDLAGAGMRAMALHHHRAAGSKRGRGVAARGREGEREVRGAEDRDRADRALHHAQVRAGQGGAVGQRHVMAAVEIVALQDMLGKEPQLAGGAAALALQAGDGQAGLGGADLGDRLGAGLDLVGDGVQEGGALGAGGVTIAPERLFRGAGGGVDQLGRADREGMGGAVGGGGEEGLLGADPVTGDQVLAMGGEGHCVSFQVGRPTGRARDGRFTATCRRGKRRHRRVPSA